jgi:hypothetical protein
MPEQQRQSRIYQRAAFQWLTLARKTDNQAERPALLAIANLWLQMAHDAFEQERAPTLH